MDLLEYQGKQLFRKHCVPTPEGRHAASSRTTTVVELAG
jgi:succinyl-CoA synthetase beta subunit